MSLMNDWPVVKTSHFICIYCVTGKHCWYVWWRCCHSAVSSCEETESTGWARSMVYW